MPLFDVRCLCCDHEFEELLHNEEVELTDYGWRRASAHCPECAYDGVEVLTSVPHLSGFAAQRIRDSALRSNFSGPVSVSVPSSYNNKKKNGASNKGRRRKS